METVKINTEYITLGQLLKYLNIASSGGDIKMILATTKVLVDGKLENRRGRKIYPGMIVDLDEIGIYKIL
ncbi:MAG: S4 domain-containing protein YaaA [Candidatus Izemoplasmataceae bacterium]